MNYKDYEDHELVYLINESNEEAKDIIYEKYKYIIDILYNKYQSKCYSLGIDKNDLYQEALLGFADGLTSYKDNKNTKLSTFITICVERRIMTAITKAGRLKNQLINDSLSLEYDYGTEKVTLKELLSDNNSNNPLNSLMENEKLEELEQKIKESLSDNEYQVYSLLKNNFNYIEISKLLSKTPKSVDNTIQRIKLKVKNIINKD